MQAIGFLRLTEAVGPICSGGDERKQQIVRALEDESELQPNAT